MKEEGQYQCGGRREGDDLKVGCGGDEAPEVWVEVWWQRLNVDRMMGEGGHGAITSLAPLAQSPLL